MVCAEEVGFCGEAKTAPSGPSAAVTAPAEKGRGIGGLTVNGPDVDTGGSGAKVVLVVVGDEVVGEEVVAWFALVAAVVLVAVCAFGVVVPHAATTSAAAATVKPGCTRRARAGRMPASIAVPDGNIAVPRDDYVSPP
jgi:hypothetical protein